MISSNLKSPATTLTNGIAMFILSVQESLPDRPICPSSRTKNDRFGPTTDESSELKKFSQMDYLEIVTTH